MCPLFDFGCEPCEEIVEELCKADEQVLCPTCKQPMTKLVSLPSSDVSPKYRDMHMKMMRMRAKMIGKDRWRSSSESQTD